jgi:hypothetical protein
MRVKPSMYALRGGAAAPARTVRVRTAALNDDDVAVAASTSKHRRDPSSPTPSIGLA